MMVPEAAQTEDAFLTDDFMLNEFKVTLCDKGFRHNWRRCPYAHDGETARRRDPKVFKYKAVICPEKKKKEECPRGIDCPCAHNVFEYWLLPSRFKTELCKHGNKTACRLKRPFCFFAHSNEELRAIPENDECFTLDSDLSGKNLETINHSLASAETHQQNNSQHWPISDFFEEWDLDKMNSTRINERTAQYPQNNTYLAMPGAMVTAVDLFDTHTTFHGGFNNSLTLLDHHNIGQIDDDRERHNLPVNLRCLTAEDISGLNTTCEMQFPTQIARPGHTDSYMAKKFQVNPSDEFPSMRIMKILSSNMNQKA